RDVLPDTPGRAECQTREVAARPREALNEPGGDQIGRRDRNDGDRRRRPARRLDFTLAAHDDDADVEPDELGGKARERPGLAGRETPLDHDVPALGVAEPAE